jgi:sortase A
MSRHLRTLSTLLIVVGGLLILEAAVTVLWQEPFSAIYSRIEQKRLDDQLAGIEGKTYTTVERKAITSLPSPQRRLSFAARSLDRRVRDGQPLGRVTIPRIGLSKVFVAGTGTSDLRKGPGHYPSTPLPGVHGTVAIAGHRTTYGAPFRKLDKLRPRDEIQLRMPYGTFTYKVQRTQIVPPTAVWVTRRTSYDRLVLSACHPLYSAAKRIIIFARLVDDQPRGAAA